jgi:hypothetical protein
METITKILYNVISLDQQLVGYDPRFSGVF